jgi:sugar lactone lactonase YvrE
MKIAFPQILALIACVLLTACGAGNNCVGHNGCSDSAASTSTSSTTTTTYTIGGTISGLTGSSLVLQNNSGNALTVSANSSTFVFTTALASGATYAVTVGTQPTGFTCLVTNGTGTVASTNVTNVVVACTTSTTTVVSGVVSILAGASAFAGFADGTGAAAKFSAPQALVADSSGNIYVADRGNHRIRKITSAGVVTTFAGSGTAGTANGTGTAATFNNPSQITIDSSGNLYVVDAFAATQIRKITPAGVVTSFAGQVGVTGSTDGTGTAARFGSIQGIAIDSSNNLYVSDAGNFKIRKITSAGVVTTFAGSGVNGTVNGTGTVASFSNPEVITVDSSGNLYVVEGTAQTIRKITSAGVVTTLAGSGTSAYVDGTGTAASFQGIGGITVDSSGNLYVTEVTGGQTIRKITSTGEVTTFAGLKNDEGGIDVNGTLTAARFAQPCGIAIDSSNNLYVSEFNFGFQNNIRKIVFTTTTQ